MALAASPATQTQPTPARITFSISLLPSPSKSGKRVWARDYHSWEGMWSWSLQDNHGTATGRSETLRGLARKWLSKVFATNIKVIDWWKLCFIIPFQSSRLLDSQWFRAFLVLLNFAIGGHLDPLIGLLLVA